MIKVPASSLLRKQHRFCQKYLLSFSEVWVISRFFYLLSTICFFWLPACQGSDFLTLCAWLPSLTLVPSAYIWLLMSYRTLLPCFTSRFCHIYYNTFCMIVGPRLINILFCMYWWWILVFVIFLRAQGLFYFY